MVQIGIEFHVLDPESNENPQTGECSSKHLNTAHEDSDVMGGLNAKLDALGFPQLQVSDPSSIVQVVQTILEELRHASDMTQSYESTSHEAQIDCSRLQNEKEALKLQVLCARQDLAALENRARIAADQHAKEKQRSDAWNKELQVTIAKMEGQQKGWQAALNRKEAEYDRLQTRMQMLQTHRDRAVKRALEMDTPPVKGGTRPMLGSPESWEATTSPSAGSNANANNEEASQAEIEAAAAQSLAVLEEAAETSRGRRVAYLVNENQKLRASLHSMQNLIVTKLQAAASIQLGRKAAKTPRADAGSKDAALSTANPALVEIDTLRLADSSFDLPAEQLERRLTDVQNQTLAFLEAQEAQAQANDASGEDHPPTEAELKERLDQAKTLIHDLDACLRATLLFQTEDSDPEMQHHRGARAGAGAAADGLDDEVAALRAKQYFEQEEADLRRARERLEQDRAMLHEEARKIDEERSKLDRKLFAQNAGIAQTPNATKLMHTPSLVERLSTPDPHADASARKTLRFAELGVAPTPATRRLLDEIL
ncbi:Hypothetical Protein FCC1311_073042 [Hondaea fermentalgiana]|uniref:Uncharacterized protein n=1 Tax=Hondaea fermentalgiana TaxID=2315210 RepID=A0A2R5GR34_9STRA|nr:Hypothetical Protein FCC1311_073042 [Hondaea fermentalgiana]|eukprot:GBG31083.1 Hypothetical Protein FCC1311_073042 [Hondaea fermentalgiana]